MKVLAIETATDICAAALVDEQRVLGEEVLQEQHVHSEKLLTIIDSVTSKGREYDAIAISIGPGSFTGLRIGLSVAKGLAYANSKPIVPVSTLEALAWRAVSEGIATIGDAILAMIDARRDDVYAGLFSRKEDGLICHEGIAALGLDELMQRLHASGRVVVMGNAVEKFVRRNERVGLQNGRFIIPPSHLRLCNAGSVGLLGVRRAQRGEYSDIASLEPMYVKDFVSLVDRQHVSPYTTRE